MAESSARPPDVVLVVYHQQRSGELRFEYDLRVADATRGWEEEQFEPMALSGSDPSAYLRDLLKSIQDLDKLAGRDADARRQASDRLLGIGSTLARQLWPERLRLRLASVAATGRPQPAAPSLLLLSSECWVPWELLRLPRPGGREDGPFVAEAFAFARWLHGSLPSPALPFRRIGLVTPGRSEVERAGGEALGFQALLGEDRAVERVSARFNDLLDALASGHFDGWYFEGHGEAREDNPDLWAILLEPGERLTRFDLHSRANGLGGRRPFVYLSACHSARGGHSLAGMGGLAQGFLEAGAGGFLGALWAIQDKPAALFARSFYRGFIGGLPIAEAVRQARLAVRTAHGGDPTWLAFALFADPLALASEAAAAIKPYQPGLISVEARPFVSIPCPRWNPDRSPPGALLKAEHGVVSFHGREQELDELHRWCAHERPIQIRLYTGPGGMGKTRLALELCRRLRDEGWASGFVWGSADGQAAEAAPRLAAAGDRTLLVVDYAETRRDLLVELLATLLALGDGRRCRVILLARREDWWKQMRAAPRRVGDLVSGPATSHEVLAPLALSTAAREDTFHRAAYAFARALDRPVPADPPTDLAADYFRSVLLLHMSALGAVEGVRLKGEEGILDWVLDRERRFWDNQTKARDLPSHLGPGIGQAMAAVTLGGGVLSEAAAIGLLGALSFFRGQTHAVLTAVAKLLHDTYPGEAWISAVEPDLLGEHLIERELKSDRLRSEVFNLMLGPSSAEAPTPGRTGV